MSVKSKMTALADAIRAKTGGEGKLSIDGMIEAVGGITGGGGDTTAAYNEGYEQGKTDEHKKLLNGIVGGIEPTGDIVIEAEKVTAALGGNTLITGVEMTRTKTIANMAFYLCSSITKVTIPETCETIGTNAFAYNSKLAMVTFKGTPTSIANNSFAGCNKLLDIYVPWSEGAVAGAPWSATKATIHYNSEAVT